METIIRPATPDDAAALLRVYGPYVEKTAITFEYEVPTLEEFRRRIETTLVQYPYLIAQQAGEVVGYAYAGPFHTRAAYAWAVETSIYVRMDSKRQGIGGELHQALESVLKAQGYRNMNACIAVPEVEDEYLTRNSIQFHRHLGYNWVGAFPQSAYKFGRWYGTSWMEKPIGPHGTVTERPAPFLPVWEKLTQGGKP